MGRLHGDGTVVAQWRCGNGSSSVCGSDGTTLAQWCCDGATAQTVMERQRSGGGLTTAPRRYGKQRGGDVELMRGCGDDTAAARLWFEATAVA